MGIRDFSLMEVRLEHINSCFILQPGIEESSDKRLGQSSFQRIGRTYFSQKQHIGLQVPNLLTIQNQSMWIFHKASIL